MACGFQCRVQCSIDLCRGFQRPVNLRVLMQPSKSPVVMPQFAMMPFTFAMIPLSNIEFMAKLYLPISFDCCSALFSRIYVDLFSSVQFKLDEKQNRNTIETVSN